MSAGRGQFNTSPVQTRVEYRAEPLWAKGLDLFNEKGGVEFGGIGARGDGALPGGRRRSLLTARSQAEPGNEGNSIQVRCKRVLNIARNRCEAIT
jgi:hypothetical protein